jgi:hypothetical protein
MVETQRPLIVLHNGTERRITLLADHRLHGLRQIIAANYRRAQRRPVIMRNPAGNARSRDLDAHGNGQRELGRPAHPW